MRSVPLSLVTMPVEARLAEMRNAIRQLDNVYAGGGEAICSSRRAASPMSRSCAKPHGFGVVGYGGAEAAYINSKPR